MPDQNYNPIPGAPVPPESFTNAPAYGAPSQPAATPSQPAATPVQPVEATVVSESPAPQSAQQYAAYQSAQQEIPFVDQQQSYNANGYVSQPAPKPNAPKKKDKKKGKGGKVIALVAVVLVVAIAGGLLTHEAIENQWFGIGAQETTSTSESTNTTAPISQVTASLDDEDETVAEQVAAKTLPSVVKITVTIQSESNNLLNYFGVGDSSTTTSTGTGSGVIVSSDGYILTNNHVVGDALNISVLVNQTDTYEATLVGTDPSSDLAVIKIDATGLTAMEVGDADALNVGEWVMTVGCPFGEETSVATGIVSALLRSSSMTDDDGTSIYANMIQTDASINPGNSGGALVNSKGQLVGICSLFESYSQSSSNVGFAIPSNYAIDIANQLIETGKACHANLGVTMLTLTEDVAKYYSLNVKTYSGAYVSEVKDGSAADTAGIEVGDVITKIDDEVIASSDAVIIAVRSHDIGEEVTIVVNRNGEEVTLKATLGSDNGEDIYTNTKYVENTNSNTNGNGYNEF